MPDLELVHTRKVQHGWNFDYQPAAGVWTEREFWRGREHHPRSYYTVEIRFKRDKPYVKNVVERNGASIDPMLRRKLEKRGLATANARNADGVPLYPRPPRPTRKPAYLRPTGPRRSRAAEMTATLVRADPYHEEWDIDVADHPGVAPYHVTLTGMNYKVKAVQSWNYDDVRAPPELIRDLGRAAQTFARREKLAAPLRKEYNAEMRRLRKKTGRTGLVNYDVKVWDDAWANEYDRREKPWRPLLFVSARNKKEARELALAAIKRKQMYYLLDKGLRLERGIPSSDTTPTVHFY